MSDPGAVLYHDADGVVNSGLSRDYRIRYPRLRQLLEHGEPRFRFEACAGPHWRTGRTTART